MACQDSFEDRPGARRLATALVLQAGPDRRVRDLADVAEAWWPQVAAQGLAEARRRQGGRPGRQTGRAAAIHLSRRLGPGRARPHDVAGRPAGATASESVCRVKGPGPIQPPARPVPAPQTLSGAPGGVEGFEVLRARGPAAPVDGALLRPGGPDRGPDSGPEARIARWAVPAAGRAAAAPVRSRGPGTISGSFLRGSARQERRRSRTRERLDFRHQRRHDQSSTTVTMDGDG